jgi:hypothetical protein
MYLTDFSHREPIVESDEAFLDTCIEYKIASTQWERESAFRLLYHAYRRSGLVDRTVHEIRVMPHQLLPTTSVMIARYANQVISTLSLIEDGELGLPLEKTFAAEVCERRQQGFTLAEASCLADRRKDVDRYFPVFVRLCRLMILHARSREVDQVLIAVHPRHARFYIRHLAFDPISDERPYPLVRNQPAVALALDLNRLEIERPANYERFFAHRIKDDELKPKQMSDNERSYFCQFLEDPCTPAVRMCSA